MTGRAVGAGGLQRQRPDSAAQPRAGERSRALDWARALLPPLGVLGVALALRLPNIGRPSPADFDEGGRLEQLFLMAAGFRPFRDIIADQGPISLDAYYLFYDRLGRDIAAARAPALLGSLVCLVMVYLIGRRLVGTAGGLAAMTLLAISPLFLTSSRVTWSEVTTLGPASVAAWLALVYRHDRRPAILLGSAALFGLAVLLKPMAAIVAAPIGVALVYRRRRQWPRDVLVWGGSVMALCGLAILLLGPGLVYEEFVAYRRGAAGLGPAGRARWSLDANFGLILHTLTPDLPLVALGLAGLWPLARLARGPSLLLGTWLGAVLLMLLFYSPLNAKHLPYLHPPLALLAGGGLVAAAGLIRTAGPTRRRSAVALVGLTFGWYALSLPDTFAADRLLIERQPPPVGPDSDYVDVLKVIARTTGPTDFIATDAPYLAYLAKRLVPPKLVDPARTRIAAGALDSDDAIRETERFRPKLVHFWMNRLNVLTEYVTWLEQDYTPLRLYDENRAIYLRREARPLIPESVVPAGSDAVVRFGDQLELLHLDQASFPDQRDHQLRLTWRALDLPAEPLWLQVQLLGAQGASVYLREWPFLPYWRRTPLPVGEAITQSRWLDLRLVPPGEYSVVLRITAGRTGEVLPALRTGASSPTGWLEVGTAVVRPDQERTR